MNMILICPSDASGVPALARKCPLVLTPFLGRTVLEYALTALAEGGAKNVRILASDRAEQIRRVVGRGEAWGMTIELVPVSDETDLAPDAASAAGPILTLDHLAQLPQQPLWLSYRGWYGAQQALMPALARQRVGMREVMPNAFAGLRSQIAPDARMIGPCWIGSDVFIGSRVVIGPGTVIEDGSYVDEGAEVVGSIVGPRTYVGAFTEVRDSFAWGKDLLHLGTGSMTEVNDRLLLGEVREKRNLARSLVNVFRGKRAQEANVQRGPKLVGLSPAAVGFKPMPGD